MKDYYIGTAPFCDPSPSQCSVTPGFKSGGKSKCGDGSCCWTGEKVKCVFDDKLWKNSSTYKDLMLESNGHTGNFKPEFTWFGKGPTCEASACDVFMAGMIPIKNHQSGDGSQCKTGEKWLGMKPILPSHHQMIEQGMQDCYDLDKAKEETTQSMFGFGKSLADTIGSVSTGGASGAISGVVDKVAGKAGNKFMKKLSKSGNKFLSNVSNRVDDISDSFADTLSNSVQRTFDSGSAYLDGISDLAYQFDDRTKRSNKAAGIYNQILHDKQRKKKLKKVSYYDD